jgi:hypothetical protein
MTISPWLQEQLFMPIRRADTRTIIGTERTDAPRFSSPL